METLRIVLTFVIPIVFLIVLFALIWRIMPEGCSYTDNTITNSNKKTKCSHCGHRFAVSKSSAIEVDWDFTGPDYYKFVCPKCGRNHFVSSFSL